MSLDSDVPDPRLAVLTVGPSSVVLRRAARADVPLIVGLLADDTLGTARELIDTRQQRS